jgi:hypothetical protein
VKGHVRKRGKTWAIVYDEGRDGDGKRIQRWRGGFEKQREAQDALTKTLNSIAEKTYVSPERLTFRQLVEARWTPAVNGKLAATTLETYEGALRRHVFPAIGGVEIQKLDATHLDRLYRKLVEERKLSPATVRFVAAVVSSCLSLDQEEAARRGERRRARRRPGRTAASHARLDSRADADVPRAHGR